jgi:hypothetical protein
MIRIRTITTQCFEHSHHEKRKKQNQFTLAINCGSPGNLRHGILSGERFDYPNIIAFFCNDGFQLIGKDTTRACQENGLWSGTMPICQSN